MTQQFEAVVRIANDDLDRRIGFDVTCQVPQFTVDTNGDRGAGEALTDTRGDLGTAGGLFELTLRTVRQSYIRHC